MREESSESFVKNSGLGKGTLKGGVGAAIIILSQSLPENSAIKKPIQILAPLVVGWASAGKWVIHWCNSLITTWRLEWAAKRARRKIKVALADQNTSPEYKEHLRKQYELVVSHDIDSQVDTVNELHNDKTSLTSQKRNAKASLDSPKKNSLRGAQINDALK